MRAPAGTDIDVLIRRQKPGFTLEQPFYCADDVFDRDMDRLIRERWWLVDHGSRIPKPGDYFLFDIGNESIIIIRESEENVNAFFNVCRHRGSRVCLEREGNKRLLTCPYHAWTYNRDGTLRPPPLMPKDFDRTQYGLHRCHVRVFHGLIFVCLSEGAPPDFDECFGCFDEILAFHGFAQAKIAVKNDYPNAANWKLVVENFLECYHCASAHPEYCSVHPRDQLLALGAGPGSGPPEAEEKYRPTLEAWEAKARELGHPLPDLDLGPDSLHMSQISRLPIATKEHYSETRDGKRACSKLMGKFKECDQGETAMVFTPLSYILASNDCAMMARFTPRDPANTDVQLSWLVREDAVEGVDYDPGNISWVWDVTIRQDKQITVDNQAGVHSSRYQPGRYSKHESRVAKFVEWYLKSVA